MVHSVLRLSFPVYKEFNTTKDLHCTLIGHSQALCQMHLSLGADIGRGGSPNYRQI